MYKESKLHDNPCRWLTVAAKNGYSSETREKEKVLTNTALLKIFGTSYQVR